MERIIISVCTSQGWKAFRTVPGPENVLNICKLLLPCGLVDRLKLVHVPRILEQSLKKQVGFLFCFIMAIYQLQCFFLLGMFTFTPEHRLSKYLLGKHGIAKLRGRPSILMTL